MRRNIRKIASEGSPSPSVSGPNPKRQCVAIVDFEIDPPLSINLTCTDGLEYEPLWTLWTIWSPESPLAVALRHSKDTPIHLKDEYTKLFYETLRAYNTEFEFTETEARNVHVVDTIQAPTVRGTKCDFPIQIKDFHGVRFTGHWKLEVYGDLAEILLPALGSFEAGQTLIIIGGSTNYSEQTVTLNFRLDPQKSQIIHFVNNKFGPDPEEYYKPYGAPIETGNIQMFYFSANSEPGRVLKMTPYISDSLLIDETDSVTPQLQPQSSSTLHNRALSSQSKPNSSGKSTGNSNNDIATSNKFNGNGNHATVSNSTDVVDANSEEDFYSIDGDVVASRVDEESQLQPQSSSTSPNRALSSQSRPNSLGKSTGNSNTDTATSNKLNGNGNHAAVSNSTDVVDANSEEDFYSIDGDVVASRVDEESQTLGSLDVAVDNDQEDLSSVGDVPDQEHHLPISPVSRGDPEPDSNDIVAPGKQRSVSPRKQVEEVSLRGGFFSEEEQTPDSASGTRKPAPSRRSRTGLNSHAHTHSVKVERTPTGSAYVYKSLAECKKELAESGSGVDGYKIITRQTNVYGVVQEILKTNISGSYEFRIYDETHEGVQVRIHMSATAKKLGPAISVNDIIRIHRATIQEELTGQSREMVISVSPHHNYVLFNYDRVITGDITRRTSAINSTSHGFDRRRVIELRQLISIRAEQLDNLLGIYGTNPGKRPRSCSLS